MFASEKLSFQMVNAENTVICAASLSVNRSCASWWCCGANRQPVLRRRLTARCSRLRKFLPGVATTPAQVRSDLQTLFKRCVLK